MLSRVRVVSVGGPSLYGELPRGQNQRDDIFEAYMSINADVCRLYNISFLRTRDIFFNHLPADWNEHQGYLTQDGEHPNARGAQLMQSIFIDALQNMTTLWPV